MIRVVDISEWQGAVDFDKFTQAMKNGYVDGLIIRTGFGMYTEDGEAERTIKKCNELDIPYGVYHYSYARNLDEAKIEVDSMLASMNKWNAKPTYPVVIDMEDDDKWKKDNWLEGDYWQVQSDIVAYFCDRVEKAGYYAMWYASAYWVSNLSKYNNLLEKYDLWLAQWQVDEPEYPCGIWQYSSDGDIASGVDGHTLGMDTSRLDLNYAYKDYPTLIKGQVVIPPMTDKPQLKSNREIADEVWQGLWGDGAVRKERLTQAGYDYNAIQDLVNQGRPRKTDAEMVAEIKAGKWGNGDERKQRLTQAGYDYNYLQNLVNESYQNKKSTEEIAREVIKGLWGNGRERFKKLEEAGYDSDTIQELVNQLLK